MGFRTAQIHWVYISTPYYWPICPSVWHSGPQASWPPSALWPREVIRPSGCHAKQRDVMATCTAVISSLISFWMKFPLLSEVSFSMWGVGPWKTQPRPDDVSCLFCPLSQVRVRLLLLPPPANLALSLNCLVGAIVGPFIHPRCFTICSVGWRKYHTHRCCILPSCVLERGRIFKNECHKSMNPLVFLISPYRLSLIEEYFFTKCPTYLLKREDVSIIQYVACSWGSNENLRVVFLRTWEGNLMDPRGAFDKTRGRSVRDRGSGGGRTGGGGCPNGCQETPSPPFLLYYAVDKVGDTAVPFAISKHSFFRSFLNI